MRFSLLPASLLLACAPFCHAERRPKSTSPNIAIAGPSSNAVVSGVTHLAVSGDLSAVSSVEYLLGSYRLGRQTRAPFTLDWNSGLAEDGASQIEFVARDAFDNVLFDAAQPLVILNNGCTANLAAPLPSTLSGTVTLTLHGFDPRHSPAYWQLFIDGELAALRFTDQNGQHDASVTQALDTTAYLNGKHELHWDFHSNDYGNPTPPGGTLDYRGGMTQMVDIQNGRSFMDVAPNSLHAYLRVGGTIALGCNRLYTNGDSDSCQSPAWTAADPTVLSVAAAGSATGLKEGYTDVAVSEGGKSATVRVWVKNDPGLPHFTGDGNYSTMYQDGKSLFVIAPFALDPATLRDDPTLLFEARRAGVNTLTRGLYLSVPDLTTSFATWQSAYDANIAPDWLWSKNNGFRVLATGDDLARNPGVEAWRTLNWSNARSAVQYAAGRYLASGTALGVDVIDEASFLWGPNPTPPGKMGAPHSMQAIACVNMRCTVTWPELASNVFHDAIGPGLTFTLAGDPQLASAPGTTYTVQNVTAATFDFALPAPVTASFTAQSSPNLEFYWFARQNTCSGAPCNPPVPNSALATITGLLKSGNAPLPVSFPAAGIALTPAQGNWMGTGSLSDYASHYWDSNQQRITYIFGKSIRETANSMLTPFYARQPLMQLGRPQMILQSISGASYTKNSPPGTDGFQPPLDTLQHVGMMPRSVASGMMTAAAAGAAGLRLYQFETPAVWEDQRNQGPGGSGVQTGAAPFTGEILNWQAMAYPANVLTKVMQPYLLGTPLNSPALGRNVVTGARQGASGRMLIVVNAADGPRQFFVNFTPYKYGFGALRYRIGDASLKTAVLPDSSGETVQLDAGETAVYLFPSAAGSPLTSVSFSFSDASAYRIALRYGYVYGQNVAGFGESLNCTNGCSVPLDRRLGDIYYQWTVTDGCGAKVKRSPVLDLGQVNNFSIRTGVTGTPRSCQ